MPPFYDNLNLHDEVLDAVEESIIAVNLPEPQERSVINPAGAEPLLVKAHDAQRTQQQEAVRQLEERHSYW
ncbi:hypothetical protein [Pantoea sp.]|uniref:hypothetical protein n=1 Tax=Pantoea sp. TaxID=69393 RepID=UPI0028A07164|nr:hypothetical protein [Pantoea sp.]